MSNTEKLQEKSPLVECLCIWHYEGEPKEILDTGLLFHLCLTILDFWYIIHETFHFCLGQREHQNTHTNPKTMADLKWSLWEPRIERSPRELPLRTKHNSALYSISFNAVREPSFCPLNTLFPGLTILTHFSFCPYFMIYGTRWYDSYEGVEVGLRPS